MGLLAFYWGVLIVCYFIGRKLSHKKDKFGFLGTVLNIVIYVLVLIMGLRMGANEEVISNLGSIGVQSLIVSVLTIGGSMFAVTLTRKLMRLNREGVLISENTLSSGMASAEKTPAVCDNVVPSAANDSGYGSSSLENADENARENSDGLKATLIILGCVVVGMLLGYFVLPSIYRDIDVFQTDSNDWMVVGLVILLGCVGFDLGLSGNIFDSFKTVGIKVIFIPVAAVTGSLVMGAVYGLISSLSVGEGIAISAGFGWYTMAPGLIAEAGFMVASAVSFMHNVIRETFGIIAIPLIANKIGYLEATAVPGVAAMDVCMPIVARSCRAETVVYSLCTGALMCISVAVVVPIALTFA